MTKKIFIEFEVVMDKFIEKQINRKEYIKGYVLDIFNAADVNIIITIYIILIFMYF